MKSLGNTALVDLTAGTVEVAPTPDHLVRAFLGGRGLNMFYLYSLLRADVDALSPANPLIFGCGLLTGLPAPSSGRMNISAKSPCLLYTSPSPRDRTRSRMPSSA